MTHILDRTAVTYLTSCPACGSTNVGEIAEVKTIHPESSERVLYCGCHVCRHRYHNPLPTQPYLSKLYSQGSRFVVGQQGGSSPDSPGVLSRVADAIFSGRKLQGLSVLEIGSGNGGFLRWIEQQGAQVVGVEPGPWGDGAPHTVHDISEIEPQIFDTIIMLDVLEHLSDPIGALNDLRRFASVDTVIVAAFPNAESVQSRLWGDSWRMVRPFGHLHYFSKASIDKVFGRAGWTVLEKRPTWFRFSCRKKELRGSYYALRGMHINGAVGLFREALLGRDQWFVKATPAR